MKNFKVVLCLAACILGLTACGGEDEKVLDISKAAAVEEMTTAVVENALNALSPEEAAEFTSYGDEYMSYVFENSFGMKVDGQAIVKGFDSWNRALDEIGAYQSYSGLNAGYNEQGDIVVTMDIAGAERTAQVEAIYKDDIYNTLTSLTTNVNYTFGEKMEKAALNTLLGMGTVFVVLIIIIGVISLFNFIPKIQNFFNKKEEAVDKQSDAVISQIIEKEEECTDDLELVAVITAAIAAAGTSGSSDDFVVRSIRRKSNSQWNKA